MQACRAIDAASEILMGAAIENLPPLEFENKGTKTPECCQAGLITIFSTTRRVPQF
jgi:hypothetical protein